MILKDIKLYKYSLPLIAELKLKNSTIKKREGFILKIVGDTGNFGISEIAPLPNFSFESIDDVINQIKTFKNEYCNKPVPTNILEITKQLYPSVQFGIETALLTLHASLKKLSMAELLNPTTSKSVQINALLVGNSDEILNKAEFLSSIGYQTFKIKVGRESIKDEIKLIKDLRSIIGQSVQIRLDANQSFTYDDAIEFMNKVVPFKIEYFEEPFKLNEDLLKYCSNQSAEVPIALDETLRIILPPDIIKYKEIKALILKPTLLGYSNSIAFAKTALNNKIKPVISSSFESSVGIYILASMAAVIDPSIPVGLETLSWFLKDSVNDPLYIENGMMNLDKHVNMFENINYSQFEEISLG